MVSVDFELCRPVCYNAVIIKTARRTYIIVDFQIQVCIFQPFEMHYLRHMIPAYCYELQRTDERLCVVYVSHATSNPEYHAQRVTTFMV